MLSIGKLSAASNTAVYYLEVIANGRDDYYLAAGEAPGRWMGSAASHLGLSGAVAPQDLRSMLDGLDPQSGAKLVGWRTVAGFDLTLSAPKSVSLFVGVGWRRGRHPVMAAHDTAVEAAVSYFEDEACVVRRGRGGVNHLGGAGFVSAAFRHRTSRESDPNLHTHLITGNLTFGEDDRWSALHSADLYRHGRTAGFVYQSVLRHQIVERLAVSLPADQVRHRRGHRHPRDGPPHLQPPPGGHRALDGRARLPLGAGRPGRHTRQPAAQTDVRSRD